MHVESFVHSWQNGTRCRDGVKVLWCNFHLHSLAGILRGPSLHIALFLGLPHARMKHQKEREAPGKIYLMKNVKGKT